MHNVDADYFNVLGSRFKLLILINVHCRGESQQLNHYREHNKFYRMHATIMLYLHSTSDEL